MTVSLVAAMCVVMTSCLKNDNSSYVPPVDPAVEAPVLQHFIDSTGFNMVYSQDSLFTYDAGASGYVKVGGKFPYLYYEIVEQGDKSATPVEIDYKELGINREGKAKVYGNLSDSTVFVSVTYKGTFLDGKVFDQTKDGQAVWFWLPQTITAWRLLIDKVGIGGHIRILSPSIYAYGNAQVQGIPVNSPLFFDIQVKGFLHNRDFQ